MLDFGGLPQIPRLKLVSARGGLCMYVSMYLCLVCILKLKILGLESARDGLPAQLVFIIIIYLYKAMVSYGDKQPRFPEWIQVL
jgi:hypothetical protein